MARHFYLACAGVVALAPLSAHFAFCCAEERASEDVEVQPNLSTAKSAALAWMDASWSGNAETVHKILVDDEQQQKFIAGALRLNAALRALESTSIKRYGDAGRKVTGFPDGSAKALEKKLKIQEKDDHATVSIDDALFPLELRQIDGQWRVDISKFMRDPNARRITERSAEVAKIAEDLAAQIRMGRYKTVDEAAAVFREKRLAQP